jgi:hypothetical protein
LADIHRSDIEARAIALIAASLAILGCGGEASMGSAADPRSSAPSASSSPAQGTPAPSASASATAAPPAASASASAAAAEPPAVVEVRTSALHKKLAVSASGKITMERSFGTEPDEIGHGQVPPDRVEELHEAMKKAGFCALAPKKREDSPGYIVIEARFPDVACSVELPDKRWDKDPKAKKVIEAVRKLEAEGCPKGCKP